MGAVFSPAGGRSKVEFIVWWILYVISTVLFFIFGCINLAWEDKWDHFNSNIWTTYSHNKGCHDCDGVFTQVKGMIFFLFIVYILLALYVTVIMCLKGIVVKDSKVYDLAFGQFGRFLPIPLIITLAIATIPIAWDDAGKDYDWKDTLIVAMVFCIVSLAAYIFIYMKMGDCGDSIFAFVFKKCFVSFAIAYHLFYFFDTVMDLAAQDDEKGKHWKARERGSWICMIIYGLLIGVGTWFWKDVCLGCVGMFIEMGFMVISAKAKKRKTKNGIWNGGNRITGNLVCSIIFWLLLLVEVVIVIVLNKKEVMK